jgi:hypothetical protein
MNEGNMNDQEIFETRLKKVRQAMSDRGLQTLLVFDSGRHNFLRMNYVAYLTDFIGVGPEQFLVLSRCSMSRRIGTSRAPKRSHG